MFVYRLGRGLLKAERGVRFPYALPTHLKWQLKSDFGRQKHPQCSSLVLKSLGFPLCSRMLKMSFQRDICACGPGRKDSFSWIQFSRLVTEPQGVLMAMVIEPFPIYAIFNSAKGKRKCGFWPCGARAWGHGTRQWVPIRENLDCGKCGSYFDQFNPLGFCRHSFPPRPTGLIALCQCRFELSKSRHHCE